MGTFSMTSIFSLRRTSLLIMSSMSCSSSSSHRGEVREIEAQMIRRDQRSRLLHVLAQNFAQSGMKQMRGRVVAHGGLANVGVDHRIDFVAYTNRLLGDDLMRPHSLNRGVAALHFGDDGVVIVGVEPSPVADLPAGFGVERRVIENDLRLVRRA